MAGQRGRPRKVTAVQNTEVSAINSEGKIASTAETIKKNVPQIKKFNNDDMISVLSNVKHRLVFQSVKNPYVVVTWREEGWEEFLTFGDLKDMASTQPKFFMSNWITVPQEVLVALRMDKYYQHALTPMDYEKLFKVSMRGTEEEVSGRIKAIENRIALLSKEQKDVLCFRIAKMIDDKEIESTIMIKELERILGTQFVD